MLKIIVMIFMFIPFFAYSNPIFEKNDLKFGYKKLDSTHSITWGSSASKKVWQNVFYEYGYIQEAFNYNDDIHGIVTIGLNASVGLYKEFDKFVIRIFAGSAYELAPYPFMTYQAGFDVIDYKGVGVRLTWGKESFFAKSIKEKNPFVLYHLIYTF